MGQWSHSDLSQIANAPPCGSGPADIPRPMGCVRSDGVNTVVFTGRDDHHIHQLHLSGNTWVHTDLSLLANATDPFILAATSPTSCVRPDNVLSVVYSGRDGHIHALQLTGGVASHVDLSALAGAPRSNRVGPPTHFVRGDGVAVVVYVGLTGTGSDGDPVRAHVDQLALTAGNWVHSNLSELTQSSNSNIVLKTAGYVKPNKITAVIHDQGIMELSLPPNGNWTKTDLFSSLQAPRPTPLRWPMGFVRGDGIASVVYYVEGAIHELAFVAGNWVAADLSDAADAPPAFAMQATGPMGYVRGDGVTAVVYSGQDRMHELTLVRDHWLHSDLSQAAGTLTDAGYPFAYARSDGVSSVVYNGSDGHIHELALSPA
jgi:hypothetical protein